MVGDQDLGVVGSEDFNVVSVLQDGTTVGEFSVGTFNGGESLTVQDDLVSGVNLDDINTVGDGGTDDTSPCVTRVHSVESGVNGEELVVGLGHHEVTFFVDIEVSTTLERKDVGIIENGARHEFDGLSGGGWELLASTTDDVSVAFEDNVETGSALQGSTYGDTGNALMASLDQSLVQADSLTLSAVGLSGESSTSGDGGSESLESSTDANLLGSTLSGSSAPLLANCLLDDLDGLGPFGAMLNTLRT
jgi:hypothetical protein